MSNIEIGPSWPVGAVQGKTTPPVTTTTTAAAASTAPASPPPAVAATAAVAGGAATVTTTDATRAGDVPVDTDRVAQIRRAIEEGSYPVLPARIGDAMIAAGLLLRTPQ
ncbi:MAG TPA: flagellar biosynthesis anti-sigma factor FlgM [Novosphingobium capsulatum]|jgi:negative regulator of flagellin synthesis FlgM|nr:flagellar biosynthesis anti-sigma factor FlgM [Novosphingobium aromaticivorans]HIQ18168.1 flagellar biosynthesis anti-sigma factor FlgM [Novosphingobium capsulatum]